MTSREKETAFKVGDNVVVYDIGIQYFDTIISISPKLKNIHLKKYPTEVYDHRGHKAYRGYGYFELDTPELRRVMADEKERRELWRIEIHPRKMSLPHLRRLKTLLDEFEKEKAGQGDLP